MWTEGCLSGGYKLEIVANSIPCVVERLHDLLNWSTVSRGNTEMYYKFLTVFKVKGKCE